MRDGENFDDINQRAHDALAALAERPEETIALVTHGYFTRVLLGRILMQDNNTPELVQALERGFRSANTGLTLLQYDLPDRPSEWRVALWNDHAHLADF